MTLHNQVTRYHFTFVYTLFPTIGMYMVKDNEFRHRVNSTNILHSWGLCYGLHCGQVFVSKKQHGNGIEVNCNDIEKRKNNNLLKFQKALPPSQQQKPKNPPMKMKTSWHACVAIFLELFLFRLLPRLIDGNYFILKQTVYMAVEICIGMLRLYRCITFCSTFHAIRCALLFDTYL